MTTKEQALTAKITQLQYLLKTMDAQTAAMLHHRGFDMGYEQAMIDRAAMVQYSTMPLPKYFN